MLTLMRQEERNVITELSGAQNAARSLTDTSAYTLTPVANAKRTRKGYGLERDLYLSLRIYYFFSNSWNLEPGFVKFFFFFPEPGRVFVRYLHDETLNLVSIELSGTWLVCSCSGTYAIRDLFFFIMLALASCIFFFFFTSDRVSTVEV